MYDTTPRQPWHDVRRGIALAGIAMWFSAAGIPVIAVCMWWTRGQLADMSTTHLTLVVVTPAVVQTCSLAYTIRVLRTGDPDRSRGYNYRQGALFLLGVVVFLVASAIGI